MSKLEIGSGYHPDMSFDVHMDINKNCPHLEYCGSADKLPWGDNTFDELRAADVLEHFSYRDTVKVLKEWRRVMKPGARIYIQCPDAKLLAKRWLENDLPIMNHNGTQMPVDFSASYWICGGHGDGTFAMGTDDWRFNAHYILMSKDSLDFYLRLAGFTEISIGSDGGSNLVCWAVK